eukprot:COSAG03_NODE_11345_length_597_cov_332.771084_1_plen_122_part_01
MVWIEGLRLTARLPRGDCCDVLDLFDRAGETSSIPAAPTVGHTETDTKTDADADADTGAVRSVRSSYWLPALLPQPRVPMTLARSSQSPLCSASAVRVRPAVCGNRHPGDRTDRPAQAAAQL